MPGLSIWRGLGEDWIRRGLGEEEWKGEGVKVKLMLVLVAGEYFKAVLCHSLHFSSSHDCHVTL